ncbi:transposase [Desulfotignum phosphitoxidans]|jgi:hypothetical protein|uniref:Putative transpossase n=1 Tax=Desulfotignum phosphitoxidans DSM 13687 TaxID=1286635 RepID=S0FRS5_9BACT|nr:transposase [Desulfotignum phosphitoxidans]EMS77415.1 putative transpossase [Desulfotignum phosphitoxidans DSM 13687]
MLPFFLNGYVSSVLKDVPHRQWVFSIPKRLRIYFFFYEVLKMLKKEGKITDAVIENLLSWRHSGFHVYIGDWIFSDDQAGLDNLALSYNNCFFSWTT